LAGKLEDTECFSVCRQPDSTVDSECLKFWKIDRWSHACRQAWRVVNN